MLFNLGLAAPLLGAFKPSIILFRIIAPHHMVRILDARPHHRHGPSTTTHRHTTPTCPALTVWSIITGRCAHQYKLVHLHLGRNKSARTRHEFGVLHQSLTQRITRYFNLQRILAVATKTKYRHCNLGRGYHDCSTRYITHCLYRPSRIL